MVVVAVIGCCRCCYWLLSLLLLVVVAVVIGCCRCCYWLLSLLLMVVVAVVIGCCRCCYWLLSLLLLLLKLVLVSTVAVIVFCGVGGLMVRSSDSQSRGREFESCPRQGRRCVLGKGTLHEFPHSTQVMQVQNGYLAIDSERYCQNASVLTP